MLDAPPAPSDPLSAGPSIMPSLSDFFRSLTRLPLTMLGRVRPESAESQFLAMEKLRAYLGSAGAHTRFLPFLDNFSNETGDMRTAYRKMLIAEPAVKAALLSKVLAVAALDVTVQPASKNPRDQQIGDFVSYALDRSKGGTRKLVSSVLIPGLMDGYSICEKVWTRETRGPWKGLIRLKGVKSKDTARLYMEGDDFRNVTAVVDYFSSRTYHPGNFVLWQHMPLFENPLGNSDFRAAYRPYWLMQTAWQLRAIAMERFGLPVLKGTYIEGSSQKASLETALQLLRGQSWFTIPEGAKVEAMELATRGTADFESAIADLRKEIYLAICGAFLFALEGNTPHGAGDTSIHQDTAELLQWALAAEIADLINDQLIPDLVDLNFEDADYPRASLGAVNVGELKLEMDIDTGLSKLGLPLSRSELYEKYHRTPPADPADTLTPPAPGGAAGQPGIQAVIPHGERPPLDPDDPDSFCGGPGSNKPGPCPGGGDGSQTGTGGIEAKRASILARAKALPRQAVDKAVRFAKAKYDQLEQRYGRTYAVAIMGAGVLGVPVPLPGASFATALPVVAVAELHRRFAPGSHAETFASPDVTLSPEQIRQLGRQFVAEVATGLAQDHAAFAGLYPEGAVLEADPADNGTGATDAATDDPDRWDPDDRYRYAEDAADPGVSAADPFRAGAEWQGYLTGRR